MISELVAEALAHRRAAAGRRPPPFEWIAKPLGARLDLADKEALWAVWEQEEREQLAGRGPDGTDGAGGGREGRPEGTGAPAPRAPAP